MTPYEPSDRLKRVLAVGETLALFPVLKDWTTEELKALLVDVDAYYDHIMVEIENAWKVKALQPENFFYRGKADAIDKERKDASLGIMATCSEICSVVFYYLGERGEDGEDEETSQG